ncbi:MAG: sterol desaturase family protein, partial [Myxococcota bacterium]
MAPSIVDAVLRAPLEIFSVAQHRTYVPFLASSALLAAWVWRTSGSRPRSLVSFMFPWRLWRSRSSRLDIQLLLGNAVVRVVVFAPVVVSAMTVLLAVAGTLTRWLGPPEPTTLPHWCVVGGFTLALFVADDLTRYLVHRAMHAIPALWAIHKIHHSAEVLTPLTLYRVHPLESFIMATRHAVTLGLVSALCYYVWPGRITQWELVGVNALSVGFSAIGSNLRHSHVWLSFG